MSQLLFLPGITELRLTGLSLSICGADATSLPAGRQVTLYAPAATFTRLWRDLVYL